MLNEQDQDWLIETLVATAEVLGADIRPLAASMMADDLAGYERPTLDAALARVRSEAPARLTLKVIIDAIDALTGRPGSSEAWAVALSALDERNTVVWTGEMAQAWAVAAPIAKEGDLIGARMAFKDAYERLVRTAREQRLLPVVTVSEGWDAAGRALAVEKAVALGYVPADSDKIAAYLPAPAPAINILALANGTPESEPVAATPGMKEHLRQLRADLAESSRLRCEAAERTREQAANLAARKAQAQARAMELGMPEPTEDPAALIRRANLAARKAQAQARAVELGMPEPTEDPAALIRRAEWAAQGVAQ